MVLDLLRLTLEQSFRNFGSNLRKLPLEELLIQPGLRCTCRNICLSFNVEYLGFPFPPPTSTILSLSNLTCKHVEELFLNWSPTVLCDFSDLLYRNTLRNRRASEVKLRKRTADKRTIEDPQSHPEDSSFVFIFLILMIYLVTSYSSV